MKKNIIIIGIVIFIVSFIVLFAYVGHAKKEQEKEINSHLILLNASEFKEKIENKDSFIIIMTGRKCSHCEAYLPIFKKVLADYDLTAYQIHTDKDLLNNEEQAFIKSVATINGTPTVVFIKDGEEISTLNRLVGEKSRTETIDKLKIMGYIEK